VKAMDETPIEASCAGHGGGFIRATWIGRIYE
jgi:hypothetical protein